MLSSSFLHSGRRLYLNRYLALSFSRQNFSALSSQCNRHANSSSMFLSSSNDVYHTTRSEPRRCRSTFSLTNRIRSSSGSIIVIPAASCVSATEFYRYFRDQSNTASPFVSISAQFGTLTNENSSNNDNGDNNEGLDHVNLNESDPYLHHDNNYNSSSSRNDYTTFSPQGQLHHNRSELQNWHTQKENQATTLFSRVTSTLQSPIQTKQDIQSVLHLMDELHNFVSSITTEMHVFSPFRQKNPTYPPSNFMRQYTYRGAECVENLLSHLLVLTDNKQEPPSHSLSQPSQTLLTPAIEVSAYRLTLSTWSHVYHPTSGDRAEYILEKYGEKYGGDMNYLPGLDEYIVILKSYGMACSTFLNDGIVSENEDDGSAYNDNDDGVGFSEDSVRVANATATTGKGHSGPIIDGILGISPGEKAIDLLTLLDSVHTGGDMFLKPNAELVSHVIHVIRHTCLDWMSRRRLKVWNELRLEAKLAVNLFDALERMEKLLEEEEKAVIGKGTKLKGGGDGIPTLSPKQYHCMIRAYADGIAVAANIPLERNNNGDKDAALVLLKKMENFITRQSDNIVRSCVNDTRIMTEIQRYVGESYTNALSAGLTLSKEGEGGAFTNFDAALYNAIASDEILQLMKQRSHEKMASQPDASFLYPIPTVDHYRALVTCWCECVRKRYANVHSNQAMAALQELPHMRAVNLIRQMEAQQVEGQCIDGSIYVDMIWAWGQVLNWPAIYREKGYFFAVNAVDDLRKKTLKLYKSNSIYFPSNGSVTKMFNIVFRLHSNIFKGGEGAMKRSLNLLDDMEYWYKCSEGAIAKPDEFTFGLILKTISNSGVPTSASIAEDMVSRMENFGLKPRAKHYLALIRSYSRVGQNDVSDPRKSESILQFVKEKYNQNKSLKPTTAMYSAVISAYGGSREHNSIAKVMELFEELKQLYKDTNDEAFKPDSMLYGGVIDAVTKAKSKDDASLHKALQLLDMMEQSHDVGDIDTGPNRYAYTNLLRAISQSRIKDGSSIAEDLLHRMDRRAKLLNDESLRPDTHAYTSLIQIFASNNTESDAVHRAQHWFHQMEKRYEEGDTGCKPNKVTCTSLINCWRRSEQPEAGEEAEKIITMMETRYKEGDLDFKPDAYVFAAAIDAWARSKSLDKAPRAWQLYQRMKGQYEKGNMESQPNNIIMTTIIKACGFTRGGKEDKQRALRVLLECMAELKITNCIEPTSLTYRTLLNATRALVVDDTKRRPISATIFETCCRNGLVDSTVLEALENAQPELYVKLPGNIPAAWKKNAERGRADR